MGAGPGSVGPVLPLFVLLLLLLVGALGAEPLHLFRGRGRDPDAGPVVPVVTAVTADHGAPIIRLVASRADPDLVPPLISDLGFVRGGSEKREAVRTKPPKRAG